MIDGVFAAGEEQRFAEAPALTPEDLAAVQQQVRARVLRGFARAGHLETAAARGTFYSGSAKTNNASPGG